MMSKILHAILCLNCFELSLFPEPPPDCFQFVCTQCLFSGYATFAVKAENYREHDYSEQKRLEFRERA